MNFPSVALLSASSKYLGTYSSFIFWIELVDNYFFNKLEKFFWISYLSSFVILWSHSKTEKGSIWTPPENTTGFVITRSSELNFP